MLLYVSPSSIRSSRNHLLALIIVAVALVAPSVGVAINAQDIKQAEGDEDVKSVLKQRIVSIQDYLDHPIQHLNKMSLLGTDADDFEEYEQEELFSSKDAAAAMDIAQVLENLEDEFESVSKTREFYNLGGWPILASLVSKSAHLDKHSMNSISNSENDDLASMEDKLLFIRANAATALGTAVKNRDEFHPWVLQEQVVVLEMGDDSTSTSTTTTPLYLVTQALLEVIDAVQTPGSCSKLTLEYQEQLASKTMYALESFLRGNPSAQIAFATMTMEDNANKGTVSPAQVLGLQVAHWVQEAVVAATDTQSSNARMSRHAIKMANSLLGLANNMVGDVAVPQGDANNQVIQLFSTDDWCGAVMQAATMSPASPFKRLVFKSLQRTAIQSVIIFSSHCSEYFFKHDGGKEFVANLIRDQQQQLLEIKSEQQQHDRIVDAAASSKTLNESSNSTQSSLPVDVFDLRSTTNQDVRMKPDQPVKDS